MVTLIDSEVIDAVYDYITTGKVVFGVIHERAVQTLLQKSHQGGFFNDEEVALIDSILDAIEKESRDRAERDPTGGRSAAVGSNRSMLRH